MLGFASNSPVAPQSITITTNGEGEIVDLVALPPQTWNSGSLNTHYLDFAHTQKSFDNIQLSPGVYRWEARTKARNNKKGKMNIDIIAKFQGSSNSTLVNKKANPTGVLKGNITIHDFKSKSGSGSLAGFGKVKVHVGRAGSNTNLLYKITLTRTGDIPCTVTNIGSKRGTIVGNTLAKLKSTQAACKDSVRVKIEKTGGKAKTMVYVYTSNTKNGSGTLAKTYEFRKGSSNGEMNIMLRSGTKGKFIRVEMKNRSATNTFKYKLNIVQ